MSAIFEAVNLLNRRLVLADTIGQPLMRLAAKTLRHGSMCSGIRLSRSGKPPKRLKRSCRGMGARPHGSEAKLNPL